MYYEILRDGRNYVIIEWIMPHRSSIKLIYCRSTASGNINLVRMNYVNRRIDIPRT